MNPRDVVLEASSLLREGWTKGAFKETDDRGRECYCLLSALFVAAGGEVGTNVFLTDIPKPNIPAYERARFAVSYLISVEYDCTVTTFNDSAESVETLLALLEEVLRYLPEVNAA